MSVWFENIAFYINCIHSCQKSWFKNCVIFLICNRNHIIIQIANVYI